MEYYFLVLYILFGILPSLAWLFYYMKKDIHPEPKLMVAKIFLLGAVVTVPVFFSQIALAYLLKLADMPVLWQNLVYWFLVISFTEELFKFLVVRWKVFGAKELDEPVDVMEYMITSALGFAALENILYLFLPAGKISLFAMVNKLMLISFIRFVGANFLHTLCSGVLGYFLAVSISKGKNKFSYVFWGMFLAVALHGIYDFFIMTVEGPLQIIAPAVVLIATATAVFSAFIKLKRMKSVCQVMPADVAT